MTWKKDRERRLKNIVGDIELTERLPLLCESKIKDTISLKTTINYYIWSSLVAATGKSFPLTDNILEDCKQEISKLPNITPNGLVLPKKDNFLAYNDIHKEVAKLLDSLGISNRVLSIHNPINIRLVRGTHEGGTRPKASTKLHTDIWAGEFANSMMIFIPLFGDIENIGVEFFEPSDEFYPDFVRILNDYDEGKHLIENSIKYNCPLKNEFIYFIDSFLLHRTFKNSNSWRLSLDFRFQPVEEIASDLKIDTKRDENYISYDEWREIGESRILFTKTRINELDSVAGDVYAAKFETAEL